MMGRSREILICLARTQTPSVAHPAIGISGDVIGLFGIGIGFVFFGLGSRHLGNEQATAGAEGNDRARIWDEAAGPSP